MPSQVTQVYREVDRQVADLKLRTGLRCIPQCGICCESREVEATILEALPLAAEVYRRGEEEKILLALDEKDLREDSVCILYRPTPQHPGHGRCAYYEYRFLLCRLFGFAARRGKSGNLEFSPCKIIGQHDPGSVEAVGRSLSKGLAIPVYQEMFMRVAALDPGTGFHRYPVNQAIRKAIETLYWKRPKPFRKSA